MAKNKIRIQTIHSRVRNILDPDHEAVVLHDDPLAKYVGGGAKAIVALVDHTNKYGPFRKDGLALQPSDLPDDPLVHHLTKAIRRDYESRGWLITH